MKENGVSREPRDRDGRGQRTPPEETGGSGDGATRRWRRAGGGTGAVGDADGPRG